jgi:nucleoside-diphosphate-sugar epimerase
MSHDFWSGQRVLLVGGAGFIGHHLALRLKALGADVAVLDSLQVNSLGYLNSVYQSSHNAALYIQFINDRLELLHRNNVQILVTDARDYHAVSRAINGYEPSSIVHLAAVAHANRSNKDPFSTFDHSMRTLENVLDSNRSVGARLVYLSSSMVYGDFHGNIAHEDQPCSPIGIYGSLKLAGELLVKAYQQVFGSEFVIIRPSALYGERCVSRRVGQAFIESALTSGVLTVNGDGSDALDFTYIDDLVSGLLLAITEPKAAGEIFNLTFGAARSIEELAEIVRSYFPAAKLVHQPKDVLMPERGTLSIEKARSLLGYKPDFPIERGFARYVEWYKSLEVSELEKLTSHKT